MSTLSKQIFYLFLVFILIFPSCQVDNNKADTEKHEAEELIDSGELINNEQLHSQLAFLISKLQESAQPTNIVSYTQKVPQIRFAETLGDRHLNGEAILMQEEFSPDFIKQNPDTLNQIAMFYYMVFKNSFPVSIADNFDEGYSTEHIHYPKRLFFKFEVFKNEFALEPWLIKEIVVCRTENGDLYTE
jgi:hypothetical protein